MTSPEATPATAPSSASPDTRTGSPRRCRKLIEPSGRAEHMCRWPRGAGRGHSRNSGPQHLVSEESGTGHTGASHGQGLNRPSAVRHTAERPFPAACAQAHAASRCCQGRFSRGRALGHAVGRLCASTFLAAAFPSKPQQMPLRSPPAPMRAWRRGVGGRRQPEQRLFPGLPAPACTPAPSGATPSLSLIQPPQQRPGAHPT